MGHKPDGALTRLRRKLPRAVYLLQTFGLAGFTRIVLQKYFPAAPALPLATTRLPQPGAARALQFPASAAPRVSIVIPVFNQSAYSFHCLASVLANTQGSDYEVIVVDDCSTDDTPQMLQAIRGITVLRNDSNSGFIAACNRGAAAARGEYVLFLNNDTEVQAGWLQALLGTFDSCADAGLVGAKLLYANGTLQEAGGIVWQDGSAWNYGRNDDPNKPEYCYLRAVDYCSGACILLKKADFDSVSGFDPHYAPAYYEDTDLAFKLRQAGKQVYYQPNARVFHFEGVTSGTDLRSGVKEYQRVNHGKFFERWQEVLATHRERGVAPELEKDRHMQRRVLVVDAQVPTPDRDSGSLRMLNLLLILRGLGYHCSFYPDDLRYLQPYTAQLQGLGIEVLHAPYVKTLQEYLQQPHRDYDVVLLSRADCAARHFDTVRRLCPRAQLLFDTVDLHFLREQREAALSGKASLLAAAQQRKTQELALARAADVTLVVSPLELELFRTEAPEVNAALLSNIHAVAGRETGFEARRGILFIGNFRHPPNVDAMHWFINEVFPLVSQQDPALTLYVIGGDVPPALLAKASPHVVFTGFVSDMGALFRQIRLSVAPLRYGAGVKGKINSSMAHGLPVVATTMAAEGMGLVDGENVLIADAPQDFADAILRVYHDAVLWERLSDGGLRNIAECFSFEVAREQLRQILAPGAGY